MQKNVRKKVDLLESELSKEKKWKVDLLQSWLKFNVRDMRSLVGKSWGRKTQQKYSNAPHPLLAGLSSKYNLDKKINIQITQRASWWCISAQLWVLYFDTCLSSFFFALMLTSFVCSSCCCWIVYHRIPMFCTHRHLFIVLFSIVLLFHIRSFFVLQSFFYVLSGILLHPVKRLIWWTRFIVVVSCRIATVNQCAV